MINSLNHKEILLKLNEQHNMDVRLEYKKNENYCCSVYVFNLKKLRFVDLKYKIVIDPEGADPDFCFFHEYGHLLQRKNKNSIDNKQIKIRNISKLVESMIILILCIVALFHPYINQFLMGMTTIFIFSFIYPNVFILNYSVLKRMSHYCEYRADRFAFHQLRRLPHEKLFNIGFDTYSHPASHKRIFKMSKIKYNA